MLRAKPPLGSHTRTVWCCVVSLVLFSVAACGGSAISPKDAAAANCSATGSCGGGGTGAGGAGSTGTGSGTASSSGSGVPAGAAAPGAAGGGAGSAGSSGGGAASHVGGTGSATAGLSTGSCAGFHNGPGITSTTITIGNSSDISGPVPGLFQASQNAVKAYVAYFNATSSICGRKLRLATQDTQTSGSGDQVAYQNLCQSSFAAVGSMSAFDNGGAGTAQSCGLPDLRAAITTDARAACSTCFAAQGSNVAYYENAPFTYFFQKDPSVKAHMAIAYLNAAGAAENANTMKAVAQRLGATNIDMQTIGITDFSYDSYVQAMKSHGDKFVIFIGAYQDTVKLQQSFKTNGFTPKYYLQDPTIYDPAYVSQSRSAGVGNGSYVYLNFVPFSLASTNKELSTYLAWLQQVAPGSSPTFFGVFAWSAAALFVREALQLGGKLDRASLVGALRGVHSWTDNNMTAPQDVGGKVNGPCWRFIQLENGRWNNLGGYQCDGVTHV